MNQRDLAKNLRNSMFAERETLTEAYNYVLDLAQNSEDGPAILTAVHVMLNTVANTIVKIEDAQPVA